MSQSNETPGWFFAENGGQHGPFTREQMAGFARGGRIAPETLVWAQGAPGWTPLRESPLRDLFPAAAPPPLPQYAPQPGYGQQAYASPQGWVPSPSLGFGEAISSCFSQFATFRGRARRSEFWYFQLFAVLVSFVTGMIDFAAFPEEAMEGLSPASTLASLVLFLPGLSVLVRRLHDTDRSGWNFWWLLIPLVGWIVVLVFVLQRGTDGPNRFG